MASQAIATQDARPQLTAEEAERRQTVRVLRSSLYPGASAAAVAGVIDYCKAAGLNPMLKPVHIVPMYVKSKDGEGRDTSGMREVIMPGIAHYRTQASRTGKYVGKSAPEWGPVVTYKLGGVSVEVPEWCRMTVEVEVGGRVAKFTAEEWWLENYATAARDKKEPNAMWAKRARGQLSKVTEAQALRMAFPELLGGLATAEEMEGKSMGEDTPTLTGPAKDANRVLDANQALDNFAGVRTEDAVVDEELRQGEAAKAAKPVTEAKPKADPKPAPKGKAAATTLPLDDDGQKPVFPNAALNDWETEGNWETGWKWFNETLPRTAVGWRQELVDDHAELLRAVRSTTPAYKAAVEAFLTRTETTLA